MRINTKPPKGGQGKPHERSTKHGRKIKRKSLQRNRISIIQDFEYLPFDRMDFEQIETLMEQENIIDFLWEEWESSSGFNTFEVLDSFFDYVVEDRI